MARPKYHRDPYTHWTIYKDASGKWVVVPPAEDPVKEEWARFHIWRHALVALEAKLFMDNIRRTAKSKVPIL